MQEVLQSPCNLYMTSSSAVVDPPPKAMPTWSGSRSELSHLSFPLAVTGWRCVHTICQEGRSQGEALLATSLISVRDLRAAPSGTQERTTVGRHGVVHLLVIEILIAQQAASTIHHKALACHPSHHQHPKHRLADNRGILSIQQLCRGHLRVVLEIGAALNRIRLHE